MDQIKIEITSINPLRGKEVNYIRPKQSDYVDDNGFQSELYFKAGKDWQQAESNRREFEINPFVECWTSEGFGAYVYPNWKLGSIHSAEIISEGKVKIL